MPRWITAAIAGLVLGSLAAMGLRAVTDDAAVADSSATTAPPTATTTTAPSLWVDPDEARIGPSVVLATDLRSENGQLVLGFDVIALTPTAGLDVGGPGTGQFATTFDAVGAVPAEWTITTPQGPVSARAFGPGDRTVRFTTDATTASNATIDSYWAVAPLLVPLELAPNDASWHDIAPGLRMRLVSVIEQTGSFLVIVEATGDTPSFGGIGLEGVGREWISSSRSMLGTIRWTLDYRGDRLPDPMQLIVRGSTWVEIEAGVDVGLERVTS